jgi:hypothetical protein
MELNADNPKKPMNKLMIAGIVEAMINNFNISL